MKKNKKLEEEKFLKTHAGHAKSLISEWLNPDKESEMLVLKAHLICEYYLNELMIVNVEDGFKKIKNSKKYNFFAKLEELKSQKVFSEKEYEIVKELNKIRNKMSHSIHYIIDKEDIDNLGQILHGYGNYDYIIEKYKSTEDKKRLVKILEEIISLIAVQGYIYIAMKNKNNKTKTNH